MMISWEVATQCLVVGRFVCKLARFLGECGDLYVTTEHSEFHFTYFYAFDPT